MHIPIATAVVAAVILSLWAVHIAAVLAVQMAATAACEQTAVTMAAQAAVIMAARAARVLLRHRKKTVQTQLATDQAVAVAVIVLHAVTLATAIRVYVLSAYQHKEALWVSMQ